MIESAIRNILISNESLNNLINSKVYYVLASESAAKPYLVINIISVNYVHDMTGSTNLINVRVQVDCWTNNYTNLVTLKNKVIDALNNNVVTDLENEVTIHECRFDGESEIIDYTEGVDRSKNWGKNLDFLITYSNI